MKQAKRPAVKADPYPLTIETFGSVLHEVERFRQESPSCWNGDVRVEKYRITIERVVEPVAILAARLQTLWEQSDNHHHHEPLCTEAKRLGVTLVGDRGAGVKR